MLIAYGDTHLTYKKPFHSEAVRNFFKWYLENEQTITSGKPYVLLDLGDGYDNPYPIFDDLSTKANFYKQCKATRIIELTGNHVLGARNRQNASMINTLFDDRVHVIQNEPELIEVAENEWLYAIPHFPDGKVVEITNLTFNRVPDGANVIVASHSPAKTAGYFTSNFKFSDDFADTKWKVNVICGDIHVPDKFHLGSVVPLAISQDVEAGSTKRSLFTLRDGTVERLPLPDFLTYTVLPYDCPTANITAVLEDKTKYIMVRVVDVPFGINVKRDAKFSKIRERIVSQESVQRDETGNIASIDTSNFTDINLYKITQEYIAKHSVQEDVAKILLKAIGG